MKVPKLVALLLTATLLTAMVMPFLGGPGQRAVPRTGLEEEVKSVEPTPAVEPASEAPPRESLDTVDDDPARVDLDAVWGFLSTEAYWGRDRPRDVVERQRTRNTATPA